MIITKEILFEEAALKQVVNGINKLANAVKITLGPSGRNFGIGGLYDPPHLTKDGVTVARSVIWENQFENAGAKLVRDVALQTNDECGDGTSTATVLAQAIILKSLKLIASGRNPIALKRGIDKGVDLCVEFLKEISKPITSGKELRQIATISAHGETEMGDLIGEALEKVGPRGVLNVSESRSDTTRLVFEEGLQVNSGYISPYFINQPERGICELNDPLVLIYNKEVAALKPLYDLLDAVAKSGESILILVDKMEGEAFHTLILNKQKHGLKVCVINCPEQGELRAGILKDISVLTAAEIVSKASGHPMDKVPNTVCGKCTKVVVSRHNTIFLGGMGKPEDISKHIQDLEGQLSSAEGQIRDVLQERVARLTSGIGILYAGGSTDVECKERRDRLTDAVSSAKSARDSGIVAGGGVALLRCVNHLKDHPMYVGDEQCGFDILMDAIQAPMRQILINAGEKPDYIIDKISDSKDINFGYDARNMVYGNMLELGVIDPLKVVRCALINAASIATEIITLGGMMVESIKPVEDSDDMNFVVK